MLFSRRVFSPEWRLPGNKVDRTAGFYGHLPKYWNCRKRDYTYRAKSHLDTDDFVAHMQEVYDNERDMHAKCRFPWHMSYAGYVAYVFPRKGRFMWHYWGKSVNPTIGRFDWQPEYKRKFSREKSFWVSRGDA